MAVSIVSDVLHHLPCGPRSDLFQVLDAISRFALLIALLLACGVAASCGGDLRQQSPAVKDSAEIPADGTVLSTHRSPSRFFSPGSIWNRSLSADAQIDARSAGLVTAFEAEIASEQQVGRGPGINTIAYSVPIYTVPADQPTVLVRLVGRTLDPALQAAWDVVPLPPDAQPAAGTDEHLVVWQPSMDRLWEFWRLVHGTEGWRASWGGAMQNVSSNMGVYGPEAWPGAKPGWGASASSLSIAGGLISLEDLELGEINHALVIGIPDVRAGIYASPAQRTDGRSTSPLSLPEGAHLRLDPMLDLAALHLPRLTLMIAEAAQRYGIVVRDTASHVTFYAQDPKPTGTNPYAGPHGYFEGQDPSRLLVSFPWNHLQVLRMSLHRHRLGSRRRARR
jgi:hypothetical protein